MYLLAQFNHFLTDIDADHLFAGQGVDLLRVEAGAASKVAPIKTLHIPS